MVISTKKGVISNLLGEHICSKDNYLTKENRGIWVYSVFPCVEFSGLNTKVVTFCCSYMSLGRPGTTSPGVSAEFKVCLVHGKRSSAAAGGFEPHCYSRHLQTIEKEKAKRKLCAKQVCGCHKYTTVNTSTLLTLHVQIHCFNLIFKQT